MTVEEILAALNAIIDGANGRSLTDDEVERYEDLEGQLKTAQKTDQIRQRNSAYNTPVPGVSTVAYTAVAKEDDTLERAFESYLRTGVGNSDITELRAQSAGSDPAGGYMVPSGFRQKLVEVQKAYGGLAPEVDNYSTDTGNSVEYPSNDDTANSGQITSEGSAVSGGADLTFGTVNLGAFKYTSSGASNAPLKVSVELLQDSAFDVQGLISRKLGTRIARKQATDWVNGAGTTLPFGIARAALTADVTLSPSVTGVNGITYAKLMEAEGLLDPAYEQNAKWCFSKAMWTKVRTLTDTAGRPLIFDNAASGASGRPEKTLLGYPVVIDQAFTSPAVTGAMVGVLGDLREAYVIRRVSNLVVMVNPYSSASSGQVEYTAWERADGNVQNRSAYILIKSNNT